MQKKVILGYSILIFLISMTGYLITLAPTVIGEDSGELISAAYSLGIPHPPGYPLWTVLGHVFTKIPFGSIAFRVNVMSAFFAALTCVCIFIIVLKIFNNVLSAIGSSLLFAFSKTFWSQAVIAEIYTLNTFLISMCILFLILWKQRFERKYIYYFFFCWGLSFTNHHSVILFTVPWLFYLLYYVYRNGITFSGKTLRIIFFIVLVFIWGLSLYLYLPFRSIEDPQIDWGNPETLQNFIDHITRKQFGDHISLAELLKINISERMILYKTQILYFVKWLIDDYNYPLIIIGLCGVIFFLFQKKVMGFFIILSFIFTSFVALFLLNMKIEIEQLYARRIMFIPAFLIFSFFISGGIQFFYTLLSRYIQSAKIIKIVTGLVLFIIIVFHYSGNVNESNRSNYYFAYNYARNVLKTVDSNAIVFTNADYQIFSLKYMQIVENKRIDIVICDVFSDLQYALEKKGYNETTAVDWKKQYEILEYLVRKENRPVYYLRPGPPFMIKGFTLKPVGLTFKLIPIESDKKSDDVWKKYNLSDLDKTDVYKTYITKIIVSNYYYFKGLHEFQNSNRTEGKKYFFQALKELPNSKENCNNIGTAFVEQKMYKEAIDVYQKAIVIDPKYVLAMNNIGNVCFNIGRLSDAVYYFKKSLDIKPEQAEIKELYSLASQKYHTRLIDSVNSFNMQKGHNNHLHINPDGSMNSLNTFEPVNRFNQHNMGN